MPRSLPTHAALWLWRPRLHRCAIALAAALLLAAGLSSRAQDQTVTPSGEDQRYTLHVYQNLLQIPTLVLDSTQQQVRSLRPEQFDISLDSGPNFHPSHLRLQGDDPISLAVLLDASSPDQPALLAGLEDDLAGLYPDLLGPHDRISVYAADCILLRSLDQASVTPSLLRAGIHNALSSQTLHDAKRLPSACSGKHALWDQIAYVTQSLQSAPGRRILLVISSGEEHHSHNNWKVLAGFSASHAVTITAIRNPEMEIMILQRRQFTAPMNLRHLGEDRLSLLCATTGGVELSAEGSSLRGELRHMLSLMRTRYILEFPPPQNDTPGTHEILVRVPVRDSIALPSGLSYAGYEPALANDEHTVHTDQSRAPQLGARKPLAPR